MNLGSIPNLPASMLHQVLYVNHLTINPDSWITNFFVTAFGVGLALALQEFLNFLHRQKNTKRYIHFLSEEIRENLQVLNQIIETCDEIIQRLGTNTSFGFSSVFTILGVSLRFRKNAYEAIRQTEYSLNLNPEFVLKISKAYLRLADINLFISTMVETWESSVEEGEREGISPEIINQQRHDQVGVIISEAKAIAAEARINLNSLLVESNNLGI